MAMMSPLRFTVEILPHRYRVIAHEYTGDVVYEGRQLFIGVYQFFTVEDDVHKIKGRCDKVKTAKCRHTGITKIYVT